MQKQDSIHFMDDIFAVRDANMANLYTSVGFGYPSDYKLHPELLGYVVRLFYLASMDASP